MMAGRGLSAEKVRAVLECLAAGMNPLRASRATGVSVTACYKLDREASGGPWRLAAKR